jgi:hypothetical protein
VPARLAIGGKRSSACAQADARAVVDYLEILSAVMAAFKPLRARLGVLHVPLALGLLPRIAGLERARENLEKFADSFAVPLPGLGQRTGHGILQRPVER